MRTVRSKVVGAGVAVMLGLVGLGSAQAAQAGSFTHSTTGVKMAGTYRFEPDSVKQGAFHFWGTLDDTLKDGHAVKQQVRVEGYGYNTWYAPKDADKYLNQYVYDGAAKRTKTARAKVCRDLGSMVPDNCSPEKKYTR